MNRVRTIGIALLALLFIAGCRAKPATFFDEWKGAVAQKDALTLWNLFSSGSRERLLSSLKQSQEKAKEDPQFKAILTSMGKQLLKLDTATAPPEDIAVAIVKHQLDLGYGGPRLAGATLVEATATGDVAEMSVDLPAANGKVERGKASLTYEAKHWRVVVEPIGFMDAQSIVLSAWLLLPFYEGYEPQSEAAPDADVLTVVREMRLKDGRDASRLSPEERERERAAGRLVPGDGPPSGYDVHVKAEKRSPDEVRKQHLKAAAKIMAMQYEARDVKRGAFQDHLGALMVTFVDLTGKAFPGVPWATVLDVAFTVDRGGAVVPKLSGFGAKSMKVETQDLAKITFTTFAPG